MSDGRQPRIGYVGVDVLNNATICNELSALVERTVPLDLVSVYRFDSPTFYRSESLQPLHDQLSNLYPLRVLHVLWDVVRAPVIFRSRFWRTCWKACTAEAEGWRERLKVLAHLLPALKLAYVWRERDIRHVHCQWAHTATTIGMHAAELLGVGFSFMGHANDLFVHRVALQEKIRRARLILCISEYHRQFFLDLGADPQRLHVVYCGISLERFQDPAPFDADNRTIVSVGRLVEKKGFDDLVRACALLRDRSVAFDCVIAGSGPEETQLRRLVADLNLDDQVTITGKTILQEDIPKLLRAARLFALPCVRDSEGDMDGLPQVLIEAMACRIPAVSTFLVRHEENGLLVEPRDPDSLARALERLLDDDDQTRRLGVQAEQWSKVTSLQFAQVLHISSPDFPSQATVVVATR